MNKTEIKQCINETIVPNNEHGITAESLNLILNEMVDNSGEGGGSGDGALRVIVPDMMLLGPEVLSMGELSPVSWEELKSLLEQAGVDPSEYDAAVKASFEHNANVAQQIIEKGKAGQGVSVVLDQTPYFPASINTWIQINPEMAEVVEELAMYAVQPAGLFMEYTKLPPEGESMVGVNLFECTIAPTGSTNANGMDATYPSNMLISLNLDGSLLFEVIEEEQPSSGSGVVFYTTLSGEITEEQKEKNVASFSKYAAGIPVSVIVTTEDVEATYHPFVTMTDAVSDYLSCSFPIKKSDGSYAAMLFYEDGSVEMQME